MLMAMHGKSKSELYNLYSTKYSFSLDGNKNRIEEKEKIFTFEGIEFYFEGNSIRNSEKLILNILIPTFNFEIEKNYDYLVSIETYLLRLFYEPIRNVSESYINNAKSIKEKAQFFSQFSNENILKRNGLSYDDYFKAFIFKIDFRVPLLNAVSVNGKSSVKAIKEIIHLIGENIKNINMEELDKVIETYKNQLIIRKYLKDNDYQVFIANGSILPRENGTNIKKEDAIPFISPKELEIIIPLENGKVIMGMGIKKGITIITGGGYSGKSTLLDSIELGIYNHVLGDGREYVITSIDSLKTNSEDGRIVQSVNIKPFFKYVSGCSDLNCFSTLHASGSISQASNIIEAINGGINLLLIDEDKSATNFMIRDKTMRMLIKDEPIIPFTDRLQELKEKGVSIIIVIGGSSEYLKYADNVIMMDKYEAFDITEDVKKISFEKDKKIDNCSWEIKKLLINKKTNNEFLYFRDIFVENERMIIMDDYRLDTRNSTTILNEYQLNTIAKNLEKIFTIKETNNIDLISLINQKFDNNISKYENFIFDGEFKYFEEIRKIDIYNAINRTRGIVLKRGEKN